MTFGGLFVRSCLVGIVNIVFSHLTVDKDFNGALKAGAYAVMILGMGWYIIFGF